MSNPHGSFIWYELVTPDPAASKRFYDSVVGWNIEPQPNGPIDYRMIAAPDGHVGGVMRLTDDMAAGGARPMWLGYVGVDDVDASAASVQAHGGGALVPPTDIPGVGRFAYLRDPQGVSFYVMRGSSDGTSTAFDPAAVGHVTWNELATADPDSAVTFYGREFGWTFDRAMPMGEMGDYRFISHHGTDIGAVMRTAPGTQSGAWSFYFRVRNVTEARDRVLAGGGTVIHGPARVPSGDFIVIAMDPNGAQFGLVGPRSEGTEA